MSAALAIRPEQEAKAVADVEASATLLERIADDLQVADDASSAQAEEFLQRCARELKGHEAARVELVKPLNDHVRHINQRFRSATVPLERAKKTVSDKLVAYRAEQDRVRREAEEAERRRLAEEQRRLDEERRAAEAEARAKREAAAREAARKEAEAAEADRRRREQMQRDADQRRQYVAGLQDADLQALADATGHEHQAAARAELEQRAAARRAKEQVAAARQAEEEARLAEQAAREAPAPVAAPQPVAAPARSTAVPSRKVWRATVTDESRIPRQYLTVDMRAINAAVRNGVRDIPGVDIRQHDQVAVRSAA